MNIYLQTDVTTLIDAYMMDMLRALKNALRASTELFVDDAVMLCGIMMLFYLSLQAYTLMTGDGKVSLLPLLRPFIFFIIVTNWSSFLIILETPLDTIDAKAKNAFTDVREGINQKYRVRSDLQDDLVEALYASTQEMANAEDTEQSLLDSGVDAFVAFATFDIGAKLAKAAMMLNTRLQTWFQKAVEYVMMLFFKACIYFLYFLRILLTTVLVILGPFIFALSIIGAYRDLYLQWISKFVAVSLYGAIAHIAIMLAFLVISFGLDLDITFLNQTIAKYNGDAISGPATVIQLYGRPSGGGSSLIIAMATGIFGLLITPLVATWVLGANSTTQAANKGVALTIGAAKVGAKAARAAM